MKLPALTLLCCVALTACAHDNPPKSAPIQTPAPKSTLPYPDEPRLTPASGVATPRTGAAQPAAKPTDPNGIDQGDSEADLTVTRAIRKSIVADQALSFTAKKVTIITRGSRVTLRGQVNTAQERANIEKAARKVGAVKQVENELLVLME